ncbi:MAG TPA: hypothetical protein VI011_14480, partial [Asanoa sp.]
EPDYPAAAATVTAGLRRGDGVVYAGTARPPRLGMTYELRDGPRPADVLLTQTPAQVGSFGGRECLNPLPCLGNRSRIWLVSTSYSNDPWSDMPHEKAAVLRSLFVVTEAKRFQRIQVYLLQRKGQRQRPNR